MAVMNRNRESRVLGGMKIRRTPDEIKADRNRRFQKDHAANMMDRKQKYDALSLKLKQSEDMKKQKASGEETRLPGYEDMCPKYSLHKLTI